MKFTFEFTEAEINVLLGGLGKLPLEVSVALFAKIKAECEMVISEPTKLPNPIDSQSTK